MPDRRRDLPGMLEQEPRGGILGGTIETARRPLQPEDRRQPAVRPEHRRRDGVQVGLALAGSA